MAEHLLRLLRKFGPYKITSACRSEAQQRKLYQAYLDGKSEFPVAAPGHSAHQRGLAVDIARDDIDPFKDLVLHLVGASWREADPSLHWGESDPIHFEYRPN
jgi:LAS superfamily LD-carboxypeptidase LdcB